MINKMRKKNIIKSTVLFPMHPFSTRLFPQTMLPLLEWIILLCPFLFGMFFPWGSAIVSVICVFLLLYLMKQSALKLSTSPAFLTALSIVLLHFGGSLWGIDRGMALVGAVQFLPLPLFVLLLEQVSPKQRLSLMNKLPFTACTMVLLSLVLSKAGLPEGWFVVAGRQAGFFQYPNTYAIYLLLAVVLVLFGPPLRYGKLPWLAILICGILLSGSRIVFVMMFGVLIVFLVKESNRKTRHGILILACLMLISSAVYVVITGNREGLGRFLTISASSSTLLGRLLYAQDAIPVILKHPLGLGYSGYHWLQGSFQTGVYSVQHVHNELLQLLLDVGWIPTGLFLWSLWRSFRSVEGGFCRKLMLVTLLFHCLLDFDTQFVSVALLLFLIMDTDPNASYPWKRHGIMVVILLGSVVLSAWIGIASFFYYLQDCSSALRIYPAYTDAMVALMPTADEQEAGVLADRTLCINKCVSLAYDVKARSEFYSGDLDAAAADKLKAIQLSRYQIWEYIDYFDILRFSYEQSMQRGDQAGAEQTNARIAEIPRMLDRLKVQTSALGWRIQDQPVFELPTEYISWMNAHMISP